MRERQQEIATLLDEESARQRLGLFKADWVESSKAARSRLLQDS